MKRVVTAVAGNQVASADYNEIEDRTLGQLVGDSNNGFASPNCKGIDSRAWMPSGGTLADATTVKIDGSVDWRDRLVWGWYVTAGGAANLPGGATDYDFRGGVAAARFFHGYTGVGGYSNTAGAGTAVSNGNPPVAAVGGVRSYRVELNAAFSVYLYASPADGSLSMYNASGGAINAAIVVLGTGDTGKR